MTGHDGDRRWPLAVLSDTHSDLVSTAKAAALIRRHRPEVVLHCGDVCDPDAVEALAELPMRWVFGNCDWRRDDLRRAMTRFDHVCDGDGATVPVDGVEVAYTHGHDEALLRRLIGDESHAFVFHGHTHRRRDDRRGPVRIVNPGALHRAAVRTFALVDPANDRVEWVEVPR